MKFKIENLPFQVEAIEKTLEAIRSGKRNIDVEMETGTGKTFTFISTIFEIYEKFKLNKFIIIVPRVAIKEGVYESFNIFKDFFKDKYPKTDYDVYNYTGNLQNIKSFIFNGNLQILILTPHSFNKKDVNILQSEERDDLFGRESYMGQIAKLKPCLIIVKSTTNIHFKQINITYMKVKKEKIKQEEKDIEAIVADNLKIMRKIRGLSLAEVGTVLGCTGQQV